jgi:hypothetical protein
MSSYGLGSAHLGRYDFSAKTFDSLKLDLHR